MDICGEVEVSVGPRPAERVLDDDGAVGRRDDRNEVVAALRTALEKGAGR